VLFGKKNRWFIKESIILCPEEGKYGVNIPKGIWHTLESLETGSVFFEYKEGIFRATRSGWNTKDG